MNNDKLILLLILIIICVLYFNNTYENYEINNNIKTSYSEDLSHKIIGKLFKW